MIETMGFTSSADGEKYEFNASDLKLLKKGGKAIAEAYEPVKLLKMSPEEREKYLLLKK